MQSSGQREMTKFGRVILVLIGVSLIYLAGRGFGTLYGLGLSDLVSVVDHPAIEIASGLFGALLIFWAIIADSA